MDINDKFDPETKLDVDDELDKESDYVPKMNTNVIVPKDIAEGIGYICIAIAIAIILWALSGFPGLLR